MACRDETEERFDMQYGTVQHLWLVKGCYNGTSIIRGCFASLFTTTIPEIHTKLPKLFLFPSIT
jgi:hypothetical protein